MKKNYPAPFLCQCNNCRKFFHSKGQVIMIEAEEGRVGYCIYCAMNQKVSKGHRAQVDKIIMELYKSMYG